MNSSDDRDLPTKAGTNQQSAQPFAGALAILVVDDDDLNQRMMSVLLSQLGHTVETTSNGADVTNLLETRKFDLVFLDIHMPFMDGFDVCQRIREWEGDKHHIPIVALTAYDIPGEGEKCLAAGMDDYIFKPFGQAQLARVLASCVDGKYQLAPREAHPIDLAGEAKPVLDIQGALPYVGNDMATYKELLAEFVDSLPGKLDKLQHDLRSGRWPEFLSETHKLKGRSAALGAILLASLIFKMEQQVKTGQINSAEETFKEIDSCLQLLQSNAYDFLNNPK